MKLTVSQTGLTELIASTRAMPDELAEKAKGKLQDAGLGTMNDAKEDAPYKDGPLSSSIRIVLLDGGWVVIVIAGGINGVDYAAYQEFGTYAIAPKYYMTWNFEKWKKWFIHECHKIAAELGK